MFFVNLLLTTTGYSDNFCITSSKICLIVEKHLKVYIFYQMFVNIQIVQLTVYFFK